MIGVGVERIAAPRDFLPVGQQVGRAVGVGDSGVRAPGRLLAVVESVAVRVLHVGIRLLAGVAGVIAAAQLLLVGDAVVVAVEVAAVGNAVAVGIGRHRDGDAVDRDGRRAGRGGLAPVLDSVAVRVQLGGIGLGGIDDAVLVRVFRGVVDLVAVGIRNVLEVDAELDLLHVAETVVVPVAGGGHAHRSGLGQGPEGPGRDAHREQEGREVHAHARRERSRGARMGVARIRIRHTGAPLYLDRVAHSINCVSERRT